MTFGHPASRSRCWARATRRWLYRGCWTTSTPTSAYRSTDKVCPAGTRTDGRMDKVLGVAGHSTGQDASRASHLPWGHVSCTAVGRQIDLTQQGFPLPPVCCPRKQGGSRAACKAHPSSSGAGKEDLRQTGSSFWGSSRGPQTRGAPVSQATHSVSTHNALVSQKRSGRKHGGPWAQSAPSPPTNQVKTTPTPDS